MNTKYKYKIFILLISLLGFVLVPESRAAAHVVARDESSNSGVLVHSTPNDDPIVGIQSELFFELQDDTLSTKNFIYTIEVLSPNNTKELITTYVLGDKTIGAKYTFPQIGSYRFLLEGKPSYISGISPRTVRFTHTQYVQRTSQQPALGWLLPAGLGIFVLSVFVMWNYYTRRTS